LNAVTERIARVENEITFRRDECRALHDGNDFATLDANLPFEDAANDALLPPYTAGLKLAVGVEASKLGAGSGAARRSVVSLAGAEYKILAVDSWNRRRTKELDVIGLRSIAASNPILLECLPDGPSELREFVDVLGLQFERMVVHQKKPIAAPCNIATHGSVTWHVNSDSLRRSTAGNVRDGNLAGLMKSGGHRPHGRINFVFPEADSSQVRECDDQTDGAVNAHPQIPDIIKVDDTRRAAGIRRLRNHRAYNHFRPARFVHKGVAQMIVVAPEFVQTLRHGCLGKYRPSGDDDTGRFATSVRVHNSNAVHRAIAVGCYLSRRGPFAKLVGYAFYLVGSR